MPSLPSPLVRLETSSTFVSQMSISSHRPFLASVLAVSKEGVDHRARDSFLDQTFLADRKTTVRAWLAANPSIMDEEPPENLKER